MTKECLCESCRFGEVEMRESYVPLYANSGQVKKVQRWSVFCDDKFGYVQKLVTYKNHTCNYKPKSGNIGKGKIQKTLF